MARLRRGRWGLGLALAAPVREPLIVRLAEADASDNVHSPPTPTGGVAIGRRPLPVTALDVAIRREPLYLAVRSVLVGLAILGAGPVLWVAPSAGDSGGASEEEDEENESQRNDLFHERIS